MKHWSRTILIAASAALLVACGSDDDPAPASPPGTLAEEATSAGFSALVAAADKAGLVPALSDNSAALTVFAPTNAAFGALATSLGFADATAMVTALDGATLAKILSFHVLPTRQDAAALSTGGASQPTLYNFPAGTAGCLDGGQPCRRQAHRRGTQPGQRHHGRRGRQQRRDPHHRQGAGTARRADDRADGPVEPELLDPGRGSGGGRPGRRAVGRGSADGVRTDQRRLCRGLV